MFRKLTSMEGIPMAKSSPSTNANGITVGNAFNFKSSRISSLNSMWSEHSHEAKEDKLGLRKIAKACTKSFASWNEHLSEPSNSKPSSRSSKLTDYNVPLTARDSKKLSHIEKKHEEEVDKMRQMYMNTFDSGINATPSAKKRPKSKTLSKSKSSLENIAKDVEKSSMVNSKLSYRRSSESLKMRRVIVVKNIPRNAGVNGVLSQVCGGPLEKIVYHEHKSNPTVELHFIFPEHARKFYNYGSKTGLLILNGVHLKLEWANRSNTEDVDTVHPLVPKYLINEIIHYGSRRCLVFSKVIPDKQVKHEKKLHYPNPKTHFSNNLDIVQIRDDFSSYGNVLEVGSVISRKLCFSLLFADIRSAIIAKRECESEGSDINEKYGDWSIWFGKDPTDKPCFAL